tara:strand:- start:7669 stop:8376 length:708 start_codon:yes stop_codon:yes gene_type:complete
MNEIIAFHGWGCDEKIWQEWKYFFPKEEYIWKSFNRGYFHSSPLNPDWDLSLKNKRIIICHSLGLHFINPKTISNASKIILINSFSKFLTDSKTKEKAIKNILLMQDKFRSNMGLEAIYEFISKGFYPNTIDNRFSKFLEDKKIKINNNKLLEDLKLIYETEELPKGFHKNIDIIIIESKRDYILPVNSNKKLYYDLNQIKNKNINKILLKDQGHFIGSLSFMPELIRLINSINA